MRGTNSEYDKLPSCLLKPAPVVVHDLNDTAHSLDVTAETLYEAVAQTLARWAVTSGSVTSDAD
jgi:hypothetical protein